MNISAGVMIVTPCQVVHTTRQTRTSPAFVILRIFDHSHSSYVRRCFVKLVFGLLNKPNGYSHVTFICYHYFPNKHQVISLVFSILNYIF